MSAAIDQASSDLHMKLLEAREAEIAYWMAQGLGEEDMCILTGEGMWMLATRTGSSERTGRPDGRVLSKVSLVSHWLSFRMKVVVERAA